MLNHVSEYHYSIPLITPIQYQLFGREINVQLLGCSTILANYRRKKKKHLPKIRHLQIEASVAVFNTDLFLLHLIIFSIIPKSLEYDSFTSLNLKYSYWYCLAFWNILLNAHGEQFSTRHYHHSFLAVLTFPSWLLLRNIYISFAMAEKKKKYSGGRKRCFKWSAGNPVFDWWQIGNTGWWKSVIKLGKCFLMAFFPLTLLFLNY